MAGNDTVAPLPSTAFDVIVTTSVPTLMATAAITLTCAYPGRAGQWNVCACRSGRFASGKTPRPIRSHRWPPNVVTCGSPVLAHVIRGGVEGGNDGDGGGGGGTMELEAVVGTGAGVTAAERGKERASILAAAMAAG